MSKYTDPYGYVWLFGKEFESGRKAEHRFVMEKHIGRKLDTSEHIHHINGNKSDNRIENLQIINNGDHKRFHQKERFAKYYAGRWSENFDACVICGLTEKVHAGQGICFRCYDREYAKGRRIKNGNIPRNVRQEHWGYSNKLKKLFDKCIVCGSNTKPYLTRGMCSPCYEKTRIR